MFPRLRLSIRVQLLVLVLAVVLPAAGVFTYYVADESEEASEAAYAKVKILADNTQSNLDQLLREYEAVLSRIAQRPRVRALDTGNFDPVVGEFMHMHPEFDNLGVRDLHANNIYSSRPNSSSPQAAREFPWFQEGIRSGKFAAGNAFLGHLAGRWVSVLTFPVRDDEGKVSGLLNMSLDLLKLNERVFQRSPANAVQMVLDGDDKILLRSIDPAQWIGKPLPGPQADAVRGRSAGFFSMRDVDGVPRLYAVETVPGTAWRVFVGLPEDEVFADYRVRLSRAKLIGAGVLALLLALAWRIGAAIAAPIRELAGTAARITGGDTAARVRVAGPAEIEYVAQEFNHMLDVQQRQREERAALVGHFERLVRLARDIFLLLDSSGNIVEANDAAVAAYGCSADALRGMNIRDLWAAEAQAALEQNWQATTRPGGALYETVHRRRDGSTFPVEVSSQTFDIEGKSYRQKFIRDISERRAAEAQIRRLNSAYATLSETNQAIVRLRDVNELFPRICRIAVEFGGYVGAWVGLVDELSRRMVPAAIDGSIGAYVRQIRISTDPAQPEGRGPGALALREGRPYYCQDFLEDSTTEPWRELAAEFGFRSLAALPLRRAGAVIGTLNLYSAEPGVYDAPMRALLEEMAADISFALDNFEREAARKQAEQALHESEERFRSMLEQNISGMFLAEDGRFTYANRRVGEILGYSAADLVGRAMLDLVVEPDRPHLAEAMRQLLAAEQKSVERNFGVLRRDGSVADIGASAVLATLQGKRAILGSVQDIGERKKAQAEIERYIERLERAMQSTLTAVSLMVELRDPYTAGHERRVGELAAAIGAEMGLPGDTVKGLRLAGYVHDIGKVSVPAEILSKPSRLTPTEFELIKGHPQSGYDVLKDVDFPWPLAEVILQHHERLDGSGYPRQLKDGEILLEARIMAVADVVEAMSSHRPYRPGLGLDAALEEIARNSGKLYDEQAVAACLRLFREQGYALRA